MPADRPLRCCMVTTFYPPWHFGGDAVYVHRLAEALAARGHQVDVVYSEDAFRALSNGDPSGSSTYQHHENIRLHPLISPHPRLALLTAHQTGRPAFYQKQLQAVLERRPFDLIHFHNVSLVGGPGVLRMGRAIKLYTAHEYWLVCPTHVLYKYGREPCMSRECFRCTLASHRPPQLWRYTAWMRSCLEQIDCLLMPSRFALDRHRVEGIARPMEHLPHFVPAPLPDSSPLPPTDRLYFLFVGRLEGLKGAGDLIELFRHYREADLILVGSGSEESQLRQAATGLPHVKFLGSLHPSQLGPLYKGAVSLLVPSRCFETFGLTAAEALSYGTPVIAREIGALTEIVQQSGGGFTFRTIAECKEAMERIRLSPQLRRDLGQQGALTALREWSEQVHLDRYLAIVSRLRRDSPPAAGTWPDAN
jgi:glycosyltransferase involved in cell wall biosynthesis